MDKKAAKGLAAALLSGAAAAVILMIYYAIHGYYPFGERSVAWCDMDQQYVPLLMELKTVFRGGSVFLGRGGGMMSFYGVFLFFLSSPLSLLSLAVDNSEMIWFVNILLLLKTGLCAASAENYFRRVLPDLSAVFGVLMSVMYSLSGYVMMYYQNDMWLDMMIIFPLLLISLFRLLDSGRWGAYALCLALCLFLNFYISFMIVLFIMMFGGAALYLCCTVELRRDRAVKLILADISAALISGAVWLPAFMQYTSSGRGNSLKDVYFGGYFIDRTFDKTVLLSGSSLVFAAAVLVIIFRRELRTGREKLFAVSGLIALAGVLVEPVNKLLQTGSYQAYPVRYGFIVILLLFSACGAVLSKGAAMSRRPSGYAVTALLSAALITVTAAAYTHRSSLSSYAHSLWVDCRSGLILTGIGLIGASVYLFCFYSFRKGRVSRCFAAATAAAVLLCESFLGFGVHVTETGDTTEGFRITAEAFGKIPDEGFVRVKAARKYYYPNYAEGFGRYSLGHYTSLTDCDMLYAMKRMGYSSHWLDMTSSGGTMLTDELLMNKYIIGSQSGRNAYYDVYDYTGALTVYTDGNALKGALVSDVPPSELDGFDEVERMEASEYIAEKLFGETDIVQKLTPDSTEGIELTEEDGRIAVSLTDGDKHELRYELEISGRKELYFDIFGNYSTDVEEKYYDTADIWVNGRRIEGGYPNVFCNGILDLGTYEDETVSVRAELLKDTDVSSFGLYLYDGDRAAAAVSSAETADITVDGREVSISADRGGYLYIPVTWSEGWSCTVNGKKTPLIRTFGAFSAVEIPEGGGEVRLSFLPSGFVTGVVLTAAGVILFAALMILLRRRTVGRKYGAAAVKAIYGLSAVTVGIFYAAAPIIWTAVNIIFIIGG